MIWLARIVVVLAGLWLIGLAAGIVVARPRAVELLSRFASSARAHYAEQILRLVAGTAIVFLAPEMRFADLFRVFGWLVVVTAIGLLLVPWRWHRRFGEWATPMAIRHVELLALGGFALGTFILYAALA